MPQLINGTQAASPEDVCGPPGYSMILESLENQSNEELEAFRRMIPDGFDPGRFDRETIDHCMALVAAWGAI
jgi:hypothetical protein